MKNIGLNLSNCCQRLRAVSLLCLFSTATVSSSFAMLSSIQAPRLNDGTIEGDLHLHEGNHFSLNSGFSLEGDLLVPGVPDLRLNGDATWLGQEYGTGLSTPSDYEITLNSGVELGHIVFKSDPSSVNAAPSLPAPQGNRKVILNKASDSLGDTASLKDLTINSKGGDREIPAGAYGNFTLNGNSLVVGVAGSTEPAVYSWSKLTLNKDASVVLLGPVEIILGANLNLNGVLGSAENPDWLILKMASGSITLNPHSELYGYVEAPDGEVTCNSNALLKGTLVAGKLTMNGGLIVATGVDTGGGTPNTAPSVVAGEDVSITLGEDFAVEAIVSDDGIPGLGLSLAWSALNGSSNVSFSSTMQSDPTVSFSDAGEYRLQLSVSDGELTTVDAFTVTVVAPVDGSEAELAALVRRKPVIHGTVTGSLQQMNAENAVLNSNGMITDSWLVPGTPQVKVNGSPDFGGVVPGSGSANPSNYKITLNGQSSLGQLVTQTDAVDLPEVTEPSEPVGSINVTLNNSGDSVDDFSTLNNLTINNSIGPISIPPGSYGRFTLNSGSSIKLGSAGATTPEVYELQGLKLNSSSAVEVEGPVLLRIASGFNLESTSHLGSETQPGLLRIENYQGNVILNSNSRLYGTVINPNGRITINSQALLVGSVIADRLVINSQGELRFEADGGTGPTNQAPVVDAGEDITIAEDETATLNGILADDGLPVGGNLLVAWSQVSGPATATITDSSSAATTVSFSEAGTYIFELTATDGELSASDIVTVTVNPSNTAPTAISQSIETNEDSPVTIILNATDIDSDPLSYSVASMPSQGTLTGTAPELIYTPAYDFNGTESFTFLANDGTEDSGIATITISVLPVNDDPVATVVPINITEDTAGSILVDASDVDGDSLNAQIDAVTGGQLTGSLPEFIFTPDTNYAGAASIRITISDGNGGSLTITESFEIAPVNDAPIAQSQNITTNEDTALALTLSATDADGDQLEYTLGALPTNGTLSGTTPELIYTPTADFNGSDSFTFIASDGTVPSHEALVTITVVPVNDEPVVTVAPFAVTEDEATAIIVTATDADGDTLAATIDSASGGTLTGDLVNGFTFTPDVDYNGTASFSLTISDGNGGNVTISESFEISAVNDLPVAQNQSISTDEDTAISGTLFTTDADGDTLTYSTVTATANGTVDLLADGTYTYTPAENYNGADSFTFIANDNTGDSNEATVAITVDAVNDAPIAIAQGVSTDEDTELSGTLTGSDIDGDTLNYALSTPATNGVVTVEPDGSFSYSPSTNYNGTDSFGFAANDGTIDSSEALVSITVTAVNDEPVVTVAPFAVTEDEATAIIVTATDADGDTLTAMVNTSSGGTLAGDLSNGFTFTPDADYNGTASFSLTVTDGNGGSVTISESFEIAAVNDAPVVAVLPFSVLEDEATSLDIQVTDPEQDDYVYSLIDVAGGTINGNFPTLIFIPEADYFGSASFEFTVTDTHGAVTTVIEQFDIESVNDAPVADSQYLDINEGSSNVEILLTGGDVEDEALVFTVLGQPANGTLTGQAPNMSYTPDAGFSGLDAFSFTVYDGSATSNPAIVSIVVNGVPKLSWLSPENSDSNSAAGKPVYLRVSVDDEDQGLPVIFHVDGIPLATVESQPYVLAWQPDSEGIFSLTASAQDSAGLVGQTLEARTVTVSAVNEAPWVYAGTDVTGYSGQQISLLGEAGDDGLPYNTLATAWTQISGPVAEILTPNSLNSGVIFNTDGEYIFELLADDGELQSVDRVTISVNNGNQPPVVETIADLTISDNASISGNLLHNSGAEAAIEDGSGNAWQSGSGSTWQQGDASVAEGYPTPYEGAYYFDPNGYNLQNLKSLEQTIDLFPYGQDIINGDVVLDFSGYLYLREEVRLDRALVRIEYLDSSDETVISSTELGWFEFTTNGWQLIASREPVPIAARSLRFVLLADNVSDTGDSRSHTFFDALSLELIRMPQATLSGVAYDDGLPEGSSLTYQWSQVSGPGNALIGEPNKKQTVAAFAVPGTYVFNLSASDGEATGSDEISVSVLSTDNNLAPSIDAGDDLNISLFGGSITLDGFAEDPEGQPLEVSWRLAEGAERVYFDSPTDLTTDAIFSHEGTYKLIFSASDGVHVASDELTVNVVCPPTTSALDVVIAMDYSSSMPSASTTAMVEAARQLFDQLDFDNDRAAIVKFASGATVIQGLTSDRNALEDGLSVYAYGETTTLGDAVGVSRDHLLNVGRPSDEAKPVIIVLTDGGNNAGIEEPVTAAQLAKDAGIEVITLSFNFGSDSATLRDMATSQADYYFAPTNDQIADIYQRAIASVCRAFNEAPSVEIQAPLLADLDKPVTLSATVADDGVPSWIPLAYSWEVISAPEVPIFLTETNELEIELAFPVSGIYVVRFTADDGLRSTVKTASIRVDYDCELAAPDGLTFFWRADGSPVNELGNGITASGALPLIYRQGINGLAFDFDANHYGRVNDTRLIELPRNPDGCTIEGWFYFDETTTKQNLWTIPRSNSNGYQATAWVENGILTGSSPSPTSLLNVEFPASHVVIEPNRWYHIACILRGKTPVRGTAIYIDGVLVASGNSSALSINGDTLLIGADFSGNNRMDGAVDDFAVYNRALRDFEIQQIYKAGANGKCLSNRNAAPTVSFNDAWFGTVGETLTLIPEVVDDGLPEEGGLEFQWEILHSTNDAQLLTPQEATTAELVFDVPGIYEIQLTVSDGYFATTEKATVYIDANETPLSPGIAGAIAKWKGDRSTTDSIGGNHGEAFFGLDYAEGTVFDAFSFDGSEGFVYVPSPDPISGNGWDIDIGALITDPAEQGFAWEAWINPDDVNGIRYLCSWQNGTSSPGVEFYLDDGKLILQIRYLAINVVQTPRIVSTAAPFIANEWQHIAATYSPRSSQWSFYRNGELFHEAKGSPLRYLSTGDFRIGSYLRASADENFSGRIDELTMYNRALTASEVAEVYNAGSYGSIIPAHNQQPLVSAGQDITLISPEQTASLVGSVLDDDKPAGFPLTAQWSQIYGPVEILPEPLINTLEITDITFPQPGLYVFSLEAFDGQFTSSDSVTVQVQDTCIQYPETLAWSVPFAEDLTDIASGMSPITAVSANLLPSPGGRAAQFTTESKLTYPESEYTDILANYDSLTIEGWFNADNNDTQMPLVWWTDTKSVTSHYVMYKPNQSLEYRNQYGTSSSNRIILRNDNNATSPDYLPVPHGEWHHFAVTFDRTGSQLECILYVNGNVAASNISSRLTAPWTTEGVLNVGYSYELAGSNITEQHFEGQIDEISLYGRALTQAEISSLAASPGKCALRNNQPPVITLDESITVDLASGANLTVGVADDGLPLSSTLQWQWLAKAGPAPTTFIGDLNGDSIQLLFSEPGDYTLEVVATDTQLESRQEIVVSVLPGANLPPVVDAGSDATENIRLPYTIADASVTDEAGFIPSRWEVLAGPGGVNFLPSANSINPSVTFSEIGSYTLRLTANDGTFSISDSVTITVADPPNSQPTVTLAGPLSANLNEPLLLLPEFVDDNKLNDYLSVYYTTASGPNYARFTNTSDGMTATFNQVGTYELTVFADDGEFVVSDTATVEVVSLETQPPAIAITSPTEGASLLRSLPIQIQVEAQDADGFITEVRYFANGQWVSTQTQPPYVFVWENPPIGTFALSAQATDNSGTTALSQTINVDIGFAMPDITLGFVKDSAIYPIEGYSMAAGNTLTLGVFASDADGTVDRVQFFNDNLLLGNGTFDPALNAYIFTLPSDLTNINGVLSLKARVTDNEFLSTEDGPYSVAVVNDDGEAPLIAITSPEDGAIVSSPTGIIGTVFDDNLRDYTVEYRFVEAGQGADAGWQTLATGTDPVDNGTLATLDPTLLLNGLYELRLSATDSLGRTTSLINSVSIDGAMKVGHFQVAFEDLSVPLAGIPIQIIRSYDSRDPRQGDFGRGWHMAINNIRVQKNAPLGTGWFMEPEQFDITGRVDQFGNLTGYCLAPTFGRKLVSITFPDGEQYLFELKVDAVEENNDRPNLPVNCALAAPIDQGTILFQSIGENDGALVPVTAYNNGGADPITVYTDGFLGTQQLLLEDPNVNPFSAIFQADTYLLTTDDGSQYLVSEEDGLISMEDLNGNTLEFTDLPNGDSQIISTAADPSDPVNNPAIVRSVLIERDAQGRVHTITDPANNTLSYSYDSEGSPTTGLRSFTNRVSELTQFQYNDAARPYLVTEIIDPRGINVLTTTYDEEGRIASQLDADSNLITYVHDIDANDADGVFAELVTDRLGNATRYIYDELGNVTTQETYYGAYDGTPDELTQFEYFGTGNRVLADKERYQIQHLLDGEGTVFVKTMEYDSATGDLLIEQTGIAKDSGFTTSYTYNDKAAPTSITDANGNVTAFSYDPATNNLLEQRQVAASGDPADDLVTQFTYYPNGDLQSITDALGNLTQYSYNYSPASFTHASLLTSGINPVKEEIVAVTDVENGLGILRTTYSYYDVQDNLIAQVIPRTVPDGQGGTTTELVLSEMLYDAENRLVASIMPEVSGIDTSNTTIQHKTVSQTIYNSFGKPAASIQWADAVDWSVYQDATEADIAAIRALGTDVARVTSMVYDARGNLIATTHVDGVSEETLYDAENRTVAMRDRNGQITLMAYDATGRQTATIHADATMPTWQELKQLGTTNWEQVNSLDDNPRTTTLYDAIGRVELQIDERGNQTYTQYDNTCSCAGRRASVTAGFGTADATTTHFTYDDNGNQQTVTDGRGNVTTFHYDEFNRLHRTEYAAHDYVEANGTAVTASITETSVEYDALGRRIAEIDQEGKRKEMRCDALGRLIEIREPEGPTNTLITTVTYSYDETGNHLTQTDALGRVTEYTYDALGRRLSKIQPDVSNSDNGTSTMLYDIWSNVAQMTDNNGYTTTYAYDNLNRMLSKAADAAHPSSAYSQARATIGMTYLDGGQVDTVTVHNFSGTLLDQSVYSYDARFRLATQSTPRGTLTYSYDAASNLTSVSSNNANGTDIVYDYDALNRLSTVTDNGIGIPPDVHTYAYDLNGNLDKVVYQNGVEHDYQYNELNRLTNLTVLSGAVAMRDYAYSLRASGHRRQITDSISGRSRTYSYDERYRLKGELIQNAANGANGTSTYSYDLVGNREQRTSNIAGLNPLQDFTGDYDARDRLIAAGATFDPNGNTETTTIAGKTVSDVYDFENRLLERQDGTKFISITYDAMGNRIKKVVSDFAVDNVERHYLVDTNNLTGYAQVLEELVTDEVNPLLLNVDKVYTYGLDLINLTQALPEGNPTGFETHYYLYDGLGSVIGLTDENGDQVATYEYDAFGVLLHSSFSVPNSYLFTGEQYDSDLEMYFLRARYYNPDLGRFHTSDPFEGFKADPTSLHKYLYAHAAPNMWTDPSGNFVSLPALLAAIGVDAILDKSYKGATVYTGRRLIVKAGCIVIEEAVETAITEGVYILLIDGVPYVGQSNDVDRRIKEHIKKYGDKLDDVVKVFNLEGFTKPMRELFEQLVIDELGGIDNLANKRNPVSAARRTSKAFADKVGEIFKFCK